MSDHRNTILSVFQGAGLALALYLLGQMLLALLAVRGVVPEGRLLTAQLALSVAAMLPGGVYAARKAKLGAMGGPLAAAAVLAGALALAGLLAYDGPSLTAATGMRLGALLAGAVLAGLFSARGKGRKRKKSRGGAVGRKR